MTSTLHHALLTSAMESEPLTITVLGCGTMGVAILSGILSSITTSLQGASASGTSTPNGLLPTRFHDVDGTPPRLPSRFIACVKRPESAERVRKAFVEHEGSVKVLTKGNVEGATLGDVVILGCKPQMYIEILGEEGMAKALEGKLLVSILAGVKIAQLRSVVPESTRVVRAMPNTASKIRESMTVISTVNDLHPSEKALVSWIFSQIGKSLILGEKHMDACTALCGSGPAFFALIVEAMADGGVMMGLPRAEAQMMAAQSTHFYTTPSGSLLLEYLLIHCGKSLAMQGTGRLVLSGQHPAIIREQVSTPAGCTIGGLLMLEDGKVRSTIARAIQEATNMAAGLGSTKK